MLIERIEALATTRQEFFVTQTVLGPAFQHPVNADAFGRLKFPVFQVGITLANLSILKTNKARAIRFSTLEALCRVLHCQPGELLEFVAEAQDGNRVNAG